MSHDPIDMRNYNTNAEDCEVCFALDDQCPYHNGVADGIEWMTQHLARIAEDPELLNRLADKVRR